MTRAARNDIQQTLQFIGRREGVSGPAHAFNRRLLAQCRKLAGLPGTLGRSRADLEPGLRSFAWGNYVIFFRYAPGTLRVIRIIEGHRDMAAQFEGE